MCFQIESEDRSVTGIRAQQQNYLATERGSLFGGLLWERLTQEESQSVKSSRMVKLKFLQNRESENQR